MHESLSQTIGAVGGIWMGATTAAGGEVARRPVEMALGAAKVAVGGAALAAAGSAGGIWNAWAVAEPSLNAANSGLTDLRGREESLSRYAARSQTPALISRLVSPDGTRIDSTPVAVTPVFYGKQGSGGAEEQGRLNGSPLPPHSPTPLLSSPLPPAPLLPSLL
jgi:hypothetical protein